MDASPSPRWSGGVRRRPAGRGTRRGISWRAIGSQLAGLSESLEDAVGPGGLLRVDPRQREADVDEDVLADGGVLDVVEADVARDAREAHGADAQPAVVAHGHDLAWNAEAHPASPPAPRRRARARGRPDGP